MEPNTDNLIKSESLKELESRRDKLGSLQRTMQSRSYIATPLTFFLPLLGGIGAGYFYDKYSNPYVAGFIFGYSLLFLTIIPALRLRIRQIDNDLQELDFRIDLQQYEVGKRETRAEKILRLNDFQLRRYYDLNITQNSWVFGLGVFCIVLGIAVISVSLFLVLRVAQTIEAQIITAILGSIGAILSNFIAIIYLRMNTAATENLTAFHSRLIETQQLLLSNLLASRIENDEKRWETLSQLSLLLIQKGKD